MVFPVDNTFIDSLARLTGNEQKAVNATPFGLQPKLNLG